jgi:hypothetical protein
LDRDNITVATDGEPLIEMERDSCVGCPFLRVHDFHYFYCRALGDQTKPDFSEVYNGHAKRIYRYPEPLPKCPYVVSPLSIKSEKIVETKGEEITCADCGKQRLVDGWHICGSKGFATLALLAHIYKEQNGG